jgi:hypothetical protein
VAINSVNRLRGVFADWIETEEETTREYAGSLEGGLLSVAGGFGRPELAGTRDWGMAAGRAISLAR